MLCIRNQSPRHLKWKVEHFGRMQSVPCTCYVRARQSTQNKNHLHVWHPFIKRTMPWKRSEKIIKFMEFRRWMTDRPTDQQLLALILRNSPHSLSLTTPNFIVCWFSNNFVQKKKKHFEWVERGSDAKSSFPHFRLAIDTVRKVKRHGGRASEKQISFDCAQSLILVHIWFEHTHIRSNMWQSIQIITASILKLNSQQ